MSISLSLKFSGVDEPVVFHRIASKTWANPGSKSQTFFESFPLDDTALILHDTARICSAIPGRTCKLRTEEARSWGIHVRNDSAVFFTASSAGSGNVDNDLYAVKMIFNTQHPSVTKESNNPSHQGLARFTREADFYARRLCRYRSEMVPKHYGVWRAHTGDWGGTILCSVMEWGGVPWPELNQALRSAPENM